MNLTVIWMITVICQIITTMSKNIKYSIHFWDWKEQAPLREIFEAFEKIPKAKLWSVDMGSDDYVLVIAQSEKEARLALRKEGMLHLNITPWKD